MTTVGYGDVYPSTMPGRLVCVVAIITGSVLLGLVINVLSFVFILSDNKKDAVTRIITEEKACNAIVKAMQYNLKR
jgi:hypothetical protein